MDQLPPLEPAKLRKLLRIQSEFMTSLSRSISFEESLRYCFEAAVSAGDLDCGGIYLMENDGGVRLVFHDGLSAEFVANVGYYEAGSTQAALVADGHPEFLQLTDIRELGHPMFAEGFQSVAILPTTCDGRVVGCLNLASRSQAEVPAETRLVLVVLAGSIGQIIERERTIAALKESEANLATYFDSISEFLFVLDEQATIRRVNRAVCERLGYSEAELIGKSLPTVHPADRREESLQFVQDMLLGRRDKCPIPLETKDGELIPVETRITADTWNGRPAFFGVSRDNSERIRCEVRQRDLERRINHSQKLESLGNLAGGVAHDFNNILMAVLANASLALEDLPTGSPAQTLVSDIRTSARRAAELCRQMLAYSGRGSFIIEPLDLTDLVQEMVNLMRSSVSKKVELCLYLAGDLPLVQGDASQLRQLIMNLIVNASESLEELGGTITISAGVVDCSAEAMAGMINGEGRPSGEYVFLQVGDTGRGMDDVTLEHLFDPYLSSRSAGRNLSMPAVLGIVRSHRGALGVRSEPGAGTEFRVLLPMAGARSVPDAEPTPQLAELDTGRCVLLVDDEPEVRVAARRMLERLGLQVLTAADGVEALQIHEQRGEEIDLVLLDMTMPRLDGPETYSILQERDPQLKVILSSGYCERDIRTRFDGGGPAAFLQKPYELENLREVLTRFLQVWDRERSS